MSRSLTALLTTLAITGVLASLAARSEQKPIREEYEQLLAIVGNLNVEDPEQICVFIKSPGGSSTRSLGDAKTARFLREHWQQLDVHCGDPSDPIAADKDQILQMLAVRIPKSLHPQIRQQLDNKSQLLQGLLFDLRVGTAEAFSQAASNGQ